MPWDPAAGWIELGKLEGIEGVVHLSGEPILGRWTAEKKRAYGTAGSGALGCWPSPSRR